ncbi:MAG: hypothetical protein ABSF81_16535 [Bacteroidales bacterium]
MFFSGYVFTVIGKVQSSITTSYKRVLESRKFIQVLMGPRQVGKTTMASECAMLGTPAIYVNSLDAGTLREQDDKYQLIHGF